MEKSLEKVAGFVKNSIEKVFTSVYDRSNDKVRRKGDAEKED